MGLDRNNDLGFGETAQRLMNQQSFKTGAVPVDDVMHSIFDSPGRDVHSTTAPSSSVSVSAPFLASRWQHPFMAAAAASCINYDDVPVLPTVGATLVRNQRIQCSNASDRVPSVSSFAATSVPEPIDWIASSEDGQVLHAPNQPDTPADCSIAMGKESVGKKRRTPAAADDFDPCSILNATQTADDSGQLKDLLPQSLKGTVKKDEKKPKSEQSPPDTGARKQIPKLIKEQEQNGLDGKQDYVHIRAKRGQATNSHSLAERVRRERISERMRFLQNLVPGCDKITGKALMLDEIINYVQSLQRQVEFLSMKLATVNPELTLDIDQILSKDNFHLVGESSSTLGFTLGLSSSAMHPYGFLLEQAMRPPNTAFANVPISQGMLRSTLSLISSTTQPSLLWEEEVRTGSPMSLLANIPSRSPELL